MMFAHGRSVSIFRVMQVVNVTDSPFRPGFGQYPPALAGRREMLDRVTRMLQRRNTRGVLLSGFRGMGKTVLLSEIEDRARAEGLLTLSAHARPGFYDELVDTTTADALQVLQGKKVDRAVTGFTVPGFGGVSSSVTSTNLATPSLYTRLRDLLDAAADINPRSGLLLTIDEVEVSALDDLAKVGGAIQRHIREDRPLFFAVAGLHDRINDLITHPHTTFLTRAAKFHVDPLDWDEARLALLEPIATHGRRIGTTDLDRATAATEGYPYLVQLIGDNAWNVDPDSPVIDSAAVDQALREAIEEMGTDVHQPLLVLSSPKQRDYMAALAQSDGPESTAVLAKRLDMEPAAASHHRAALIDKGILVTVEHGYVDFAIPYLREHIRTHGATPHRPSARPAGTFGPAATADVVGLAHPRPFRELGPTQSQFEAPAVDEPGTDTGLDPM